MKIKHGVFMAIFVLCVIPLFLVSAIFLYTNEVETKTLFEESLSVAMEAQIAALEKFHHDELVDMKIISRLPAAKNLLTNTTDTLDADQAYISGLLRVRVEENSYIERIIIVDKNFTYVAASEDLTEQTSIIENEIHNYTFVDDIFYTDVRYSSTYDCNVLGSIYRVQQNNEVLGYIVKIYNLDFFDTLRTDISLWEGAAFYLMDDCRNIITAGTNKNSVQKFTSEKEDRTDYFEKLNAIDFTAKPKGTFHYQFRGSRYVTAYGTTSFGGWLALLSVDLDAHLNTKQTLIFVITLVISIVVLAIYWFNRYFIKKVYNPIQTLESSLEAVKNKRDYTVRLPIKTKDEFRDIFTQVNALLEHIDEKNKVEQARQAELQIKAELDLLSGLYNKVTATQKIETMLRTADSSCDRYALMIVDFDNFKQINDNFGHMYGDAVITKFSEGLKKLFRKEDILGRIGGDEFFILLKNYDTKNLLCKKAKAVTDLVSGLFLNEDGKPILSTSIGIALFPQDAVTFEALYQNADSALYTAKESGKDCYAFFDGSIHEM